jgi:ATP synthase B/B' subunit
MPQRHRVTEKVIKASRADFTFLSVSAPLWLLIILQEPRWWDYPGVELWKFVNLAVFVGGLVYLLTRKMKLGEAFKTRRETIKQELAKAQQERDAAIAKLKEVEERLGRLDNEVSTIREQSEREAAEERNSASRQNAKLREPAKPPSTNCETMPRRLPCDWLKRSFAAK